MTMANWTGFMAEDKLRSIRMLQAFRWFCPDCQLENFDRAENVAFSDPEQETEARLQLGIPEGALGEIVQVPSSVTCRGCLAMFEPGPPEQEGT